MLNGQHFCMAGMGPHVTLLGCIITDMVELLHSLQSALTYAVDHSFNSIRLDRDMSTNDMIIAFVNGASASEAGDAEIHEVAHEALYVVFWDELTQLVVRDGESATKFVIVSVTGASSNTNTPTPQPLMRTKH